MKSDEILRVEGDWALVPVVILTREEREVVLVGMYHFASLQFFELVKGLIDEYEGLGYKVLYEDTGFPIPELDEVNSELDKRLEAHGLGYQFERLKPKQGWVSADFSLDDWRSHFPQEIEDIAKYAMGLRKRFEYYGSAEWLRRLAEFLSRPSWELPGVVEHPVIVGLRNEKALKVILAHTEQANVVSHWGCGHLPGVKKLLIEAGFVEIETRWIPAVNWKSLKSERE